MGRSMEIRILADADSVAREAAAIIALEARAAVAARGRFVVAVSGGHTPWQMLQVLAGEEVPWKDVHVVQVDERVAPAGDPDRNLAHLRESLLEHAPLRPEQIYAMPVESSDLEAAAMRYALTLREIAGSPPVLDLISPGPRCRRPHGLTGARRCGSRCYRGRRGADRAVPGRRRMTLTYPILNRSRRVLWLVTGSEKASMLVRLRDGDASIPAGRVRRDEALVLADRRGSTALIHHQGIICGVAFRRRRASARSSLRRIASYASVVAPRRLAPDALLVIRNPSKPESRFGCGN